MVDSNQFDFFYLRNQNDYLSQSRSEIEKNLNAETIRLQAEKKYQEKFSRVSKIVQKKCLVQGVWEPENNLILIVNEDRCLKQYIPFIHNGRKYLKRFEALFLLESRSLNLKYKEISLSIEDCYHLLLHNFRDHQLYRIFSVLSRAGYHVKQLNNEYDLAKEGKGFKRKLHNLEKEDSENESEVTDNNSIDTSNIFKVITSVKPFKIESIEKLNQIDKKLIQNYQESELPESSSLLYSIKQSSRPVEVSPIFQGLRTGSIEPILPLGSILTTEELFETIQSKSSKCLSWTSEAINTALQIDFAVYSHHKDRQALFMVMLFDESESFPPIRDISTIIETISPIPLYLVFVSKSMNFNFYHFDHLKSNDRFPRLWERLHNKEKGF
ncbi:Ubiquitin conjugation factor E4 B [Sarcoptes scabiei]|nr:Ubiquitin conjugation factor E4 B [Sarcoptes scabiei]